MTVETMIDRARKYAEADIRSAEAAYARQEERLIKATNELQRIYSSLTSATDAEEIEALEEEASELAEELGIEFIYMRADGTPREYTPEAFWEPSGGCSWVESAQYGYDYGWFTRQTGP